MRVGMACYPTPGGSGVVATELGSYLAARGHDVAFISYSKPLRLRELPDRVTFHEVEIVEYPLLQNFPYDLAVASKMVEVAREKQLDVLHVHYAIPFAAAALIARQLLPNLKVVVTLHGTDVTKVGNSPSFMPITAAVLDACDAVTAVSHYLREEAYRQFHIAKDIDVIHNFIDPARHWRPHPACVPRDAQSQQATLIHISNFRPVKRVGDVIRVFAKVAAAVDARLVLVGDGPDSAMVMQLARDLGVASRVSSLGVVDQVAPLLATADLMLLPSESESFGLVALEAMASGVPVVGSDIGGLPEVVEHGVTGLLAPVGDVDRMAELAIAILTDPNRCIAFSEAASHRATERFGYESIVPRYEAVYERVLG